MAHFNLVCKMQIIQAVNDTSQKHYFVKHLKMKTKKLLLEMK